MDRLHLRQTEQVVCTTHHNISHITYIETHVTKTFGNSSKHLKEYYAVFSEPINENNTHKAAL